MKDRNSNEGTFSGDESINSQRILHNKSQIMKQLSMTCSNELNTTSRHRQLQQKYHKAQQALSS